jgi:hypothetical protein
MNNLNEAISWFVDALALWFRCLSNPVKILGDLLSAEGRGDISGVAKLWTTSTLLAFVLQVPLLQMFGISWSNAGFYLPSLLTQALTLGLISLGLHLGLRLFRVQSRYRTTLVICATLASLPAPMLALADLIPDYRRFQITKALKADHWGMWDTVRTYWVRATTVTHGNWGTDLYAGCINTFFIAVGLFGLALLADVAAQWYRVERTRTFAAIGLTFPFTFLIVSLVSVPFDLFMRYVFIQTN